MTEFSYVAGSERDTDRLGGALSAALPTSATIALCGTLGAGKTRLVQAIAAACGIPREEVVSPTFVLCHEYHGNRTIYHLDAYRLTGAEELRALGIDEYFSADALTIIEWADRILPALPADYLQINIEIISPNTRHFAITPIGSSLANVLSSLQSGLHSSSSEN
jgi:tRNA threonylcarbamoyladenosine biosynthesis protein TsaE